VAAPLFRYSETPIRLSAERLSVYPQHPTTVVAEKGEVVSERRVNVLLVGVGNLGRRFARAIEEKRDELIERYRLDVRIVGAADSRGTAISPDGLDGAAIDAIKRAGGSVGDLPAIGRPGMTGLELVEAVDADALCEASPVNLDAGAEPALSHVRRALERGLHVSTPNKGPIVVAYRELTALAEASGVQLRFDGTVAGGLPAIALGARDLRGARIDRLEAVPNLTTGFVLDRLASGASWETAIDEARRGGALEGDGSWDLDGWDAASKLVILAQAVLDLDVRIDDVAMEGIRGVDLDWLRAESVKRSVRLVARAERRADGTFDLSVAPDSLASEHPLGRLGEKGMGVTIESDLFGKITSIIDEPTPLPSAMTMLRDLLAIYVA
jgi:homoserine dehydrogenase